MTWPAVNPQDRRLILVDVINSFFVEGMPNYYPEAARRARAARAGCLRGASARPHRRACGRAAPSGLRRLRVAETAASPFRRRSPTRRSSAGFAPAGPTRDRCPKRRYSAFFATDLALFLREQKIERVVIAGVKTNVCIRATAQDAFAHGFDVVVPREATNSNRPHLAEASLEDIDRYFGEVVPLDEALEMLA